MFTCSIIRLSMSDIDQLCIRRIPLSVLGTSWAQILFSPRVSSNKCSSPDAIIKNITRDLLRLERTMNSLCH